MNGVGRFYAAAAASGALILVGLIVYAELDRAYRRIVRSRRARRRRGYIDHTFACSDPEGQWIQDVKDSR